MREEGGGKDVTDQHEEPSPAGRGQGEGVASTPESTVPSSSLLPPPSSLPSLVSSPQHTAPPGGSRRCAVSSPCFNGSSATSPVWP